MFDTLIKNGLVIDGSGTPCRRADIGVLNGKIEVVGCIEQGQAKCVIDALGMHVAPGFIDLHSHSDFTLLMDGRGESFIRQGVTTEVIGNCGLSCAPLLSPETLKRNVFCYKEPYKAGWSTMAGYFEELEKRALGINVVSLAGHAAIRSSVMGFENRTASEDEVSEMAVLLRACMQDGAWGMSSGLEYFPGSSASKYEIDSLCQIVHEYDGLYTTHVRNRDEQYQDGFTEAFLAAESNDVRLQISHAVPKYGAPEDAVDWLLEKFEIYTRKFDIACDVIPYEWGPTTMTAILPAELLKNDISEIVSKLRDKSVRDVIRHQDPFFWLLIRDQRWDLIRLYYSEKFPQLIGKNVFELAEALQAEPFDSLLDILAEEGDGMFGVLMMGKIKRGVDLTKVIKYERCGVISDGLSLSPTGLLKDTSWSPGCYGWVSQFFERFVGQGKPLSLEEGVARITSLPASRIGLKRRGLIKKGNWADIVIFDESRLKDKSSLRQPAVFSDGVRHVLISGELVVQDGHYLGTTGGRLLKRGDSSE